MANSSTIVTSVGWFLWFSSAGAIVLQILVATTTSSTTTPSKHLEIALRYLEEGADEDDIYAADQTIITSNDDDGVEWFQLERWIDPQSLAYDMIEGVLYVCDAFFIAWILWGCLVHCGVLPDERLSRRRRRLKDGRGVFAPIRDFDPLESDDEDASRDSMEYGDSHQSLLEDEQVDIKKEEKKLMKAAEKFFNKAEKHKKQKKNAPGPGEEGILLLDLEMADQPQRKHDADVVFL